MKIDLDMLFKLLKADTKTLLHNPDKFWNIKNISSNDRYIYIDNNSSVLAVAHLDTVQDGSGKRWGGEMWDENTKTWKKNAIVKQVEHPKPKLVPVGIDDWQLTSIALDDRLGVYIIMNLLPELGINVDVLLTSDEEIANSSAKEFVTGKEYNWMFQFDRHGYGNVVMYQYETRKLNGLLEDVGYDIQDGTFSDISELDKVGCSGFNFGTGYINEHSDFCRTRKTWIEVVVSMFSDFYNSHRDTRLEYAYKTYPAYNKYAYSGRGRWDNEFLSATAPVSSKDYGLCKICKTPLLEHETDDICDMCVEYQEAENPEDVVARTEIKCSGCELWFAPEDLVYDNDDPYRPLCYDCVDAWNFDIP